MIIALIALYGLGVAGFSRQVIKQLHDPKSTLGQTAKAAPALACLGAAVVVALWPVVFPLAALF